MHLMLKKMISLGLVLSLALVFAAYAQKAEVVTGTIKNVMPSVAEGKYDLLLSLEGRPETFLVPGGDAPKFGLTKSVTVSSGPEFLQMLQDMEGLKGWKVKLTCVETGNPQGPAYQVKALEKLAGK